MESTRFDSVCRISRAATAAVACCALLLATPAWAGTPEEDAAVAVAQQWAKAVTTRDVDAQMKLLPATMFAKEPERERARLQKVHENELAVIRKQKYAEFSLGPPMQTFKSGNATAVIVPYRSVLETAGEGRLQVESSLIALTLDGRSWSVVDGSGQNLKSLKMLIPGYTGGLNVPAVRSVVVKSE